MVLSKRERYIGIITGLVLAVLVLDYFIVSPLLAQMDALNGKIAKARNEVGNATDLIDLSRRAQTRWAEMSRGAVRTDPSQADQIVNNVSDWARDAGMSLSSVKPERDEKEKDFGKKSYRATGAGRMSEIGRFLWHIQTAPVPVRITDLTITSRKEGSDDLSISLGIATIYQLPETDKSNHPAGNATASLTREVLP